MFSDARAALKLNPTLHENAPDLRGLPVPNEVRRDALYRNVKPDARATLAGSLVTLEHDLSTKFEREQWGVLRIV